jgi:hypothetical protein
LRKHHTNKRIFLKSTFIRYFYSYLYYIRFAFKTRSFHNQDDIDSSG